ncbi:MAG: transglutaminase-like cysteine peptidase [Gammaproteobacteria bacterium]|nr:transglutaminase-like cysteine peptidase [Gammaproteobacteria bacterium]
MQERTGYLKTFLIIVLLMSLTTSWSFTDNEMLNELKSAYGQRAYDKGLELQQLILNLQGKNEKTKLQSVNTFFNDFTYITDQELWKQEDYWATPTEFIGLKGGDCEDYVISKYFTLRTLGISDKKLFLTYVKSTKQNLPHMVLNYFETPTSVPLVLDNYNTSLLPANKRGDLKPVYSFNADSLFSSNPSAGLGKSLPTDRFKNSKWDKLLSDVRRDRQ